LAFAHQDRYPAALPVARHAQVPPPASHGK
jgi:hypothetical protein